MTLISSISGIRGTVNGRNSLNLTPVDVVKYVSAYGTWIKSKRSSDNNTIVVGRDGRISGPTLLEIVKSTLVSMGINVIDTDLSTTPTTQIIIQEKKAEGGIILTASHNPKNWNALKLFNSKGEFLVKDEAEEIFEIVKEHKGPIISESGIKDEKDAKYIYERTGIRNFLIGESLLKSDKPGELMKKLIQITQ